MEQARENEEKKTKQNKENKNVRMPRDIGTVVCTV